MKYRNSKISKRLYYTEVSVKNEECEGVYRLLGTGFKASEIWDKIYEELGSYRFEIKKVEEKENNFVMSLIDFMEESEIEEVNEMEEIVNEGE